MCLSPGLMTSLYLPLTRKVCEGPQTKSKDYLERTREKEAFFRIPRWINYFSAPSSTLHFRLETKRKLFCFGVCWSVVSLGGLLVAKIPAELCPRIFSSSSCFLLLLLHFGWLVSRSRIAFLFLPSLWKEDFVSSWPKLRIVWWSRLSSSPCRSRLKKKTSSWRMSRRVKIFPPKRKNIPSWEEEKEDKTKFFNKTRTFFLRLRPNITFAM